jgi:hypothetical protein
MLYIHDTSCISPQQTFEQTDTNRLHLNDERMMMAIEPSYEGIPPGMLRRMGKAVRMGLGAAMILIAKTTAPDGIIIGTANAGKEDCVKFMQQIVDYDEGLLTPLNFVQSTPNAIAATIGLLTKNHGYNNTHVHLWLAFEYALTDAAMMIAENPRSTYLIGAVDDISGVNYIFEDKSGSYKTKPVSNDQLYENPSPGSLAGEGANMFLVSGLEENAIAKIIAAETLVSDDELLLRKTLQDFINNNLPADEKIDLLLTGENGDSRLLKYYETCETLLSESTVVARFKHLCGEYPTAVAMGLWLCCQVLKQQFVPAHTIKKAGEQTRYKHILMYNSCKGGHHSFMLIAGC